MVFISSSEIKMECRERCFGIDSLKILWLFRSLPLHVFDIHRFALKVFKGFLSIQAISKIFTFLIAI